MRAILLSFDDDWKRWKALVFGWLSGTLIGAIFSGTDASLDTLAIVSLVSAFLVFVFMLRSHQAVPAVSNGRAKSKRAFVQFAYLSVTALMMTIIEKLLRTPESVHAAAEEQFGATLNSTPAFRPPKAKIQAVQSRVQQSLIEHPNQGEVRKTLLSDYAMMQAALVYSGSVPSPHGPNATISFDPKLPLERKGPMWRNIGAYAFEGLTFKTSAPGAKLLELSSLRSADPIFKDCKIDEFSVDLGDVVWINVRFDKCTLSYAGGPLLLIGVRTEHCTLEIRERVGPDLANALKSVFSSSEAITFTSQYPT